MCSDSLFIASLVLEGQLENQGAGNGNGNGSGRRERESYKLTRASLFLYSPVLEDAKTPCTDGPLVH